MGEFLVTIIIIVKMNSFAKLLTGALKANPQGQFPPKTILHLQSLGDDIWACEVCNNDVQVVAKATDRNPMEVAGALVYTNPISKDVDVVFCANCTNTQARRDLKHCAECEEW